VLKNDKIFTLMAFWKRIVEALYVCFLSTKLILDVLLLCQSQPAHQS